MSPSPLSDRAVNPNANANGSVGWPDATLRE